MRFFVLLALCAAAASAATISDVATGAVPSTTVAAPGTVTSGDFTYFKGRYGGNDTVGEGVDDEIHWVFDFSGQPGLGAITNGAALTAATLRLKLTPTDFWIITDTVWIDGLPEISSPLIQSLTVGAAADITVNLLDYYTSAQIQKALKAGNGKLNMLFQDDATLTYAALTLTNPTAVPEPATLGVAAAALAATALVLRKRR